MTFKIQLKYTDSLEIQLSLSLTTMHLRLYQQIYFLSEEQYKPIGYQQLLVVQILLAGKSLMWELNFMIQNHEYERCLQYDASWKTTTDGNYSHFLVPNVLYLVMGHPLVMGQYFHFVKTNKTYNNPLTIHLKKLIFE